jgi:hypothetical protein
MTRARLLASLVVVLVVAWAFPASTQTPPVTPPVTSALDRYASGDFQGAVQVLTPTATDILIDEFRKGTPAWLNAGGPDLPSHRRLVVAALVLELLLAKQLSSDAVSPTPTVRFRGIPVFTGTTLAEDEWNRAASLWDVGQSYQRLLEWACDLLRADVPQPAERIWDEASIALLEGVQAIDALDRHLPHLEPRFPDDSRFVLARAIAAESRTWPETRDEAGQRALAKATTVPTLFEQAATRPDVRAEAQVRWGYYESRLNHPDAALQHFDQVEPGADTFVAYLQHLLRGRAFEGVGREQDAMAEYLLAREAAPHAQTAALALAAALVRENQRTEAAAVVHDAVTTPLPAVNLADFDPWLMYGQADSRFWLPLVAQLHAAVMSPR